MAIRTKAAVVLNFWLVRVEFFTQFSPRGPLLVLNYVLVFKLRGVQFASRRVRLTMALSVLCSSESFRSVQG